MLLRKWGQQQNACRALWTSESANIWGYFEPATAGSSFWRDACMGIDTWHARRRCYTASNARRSPTWHPHAARPTATQYPLTLDEVSRLFDDAGLPRSDSPACRIIRRDEPLRRRAQANSSHQRERRRFRWGTAGCPIVVFENRLLVIADAAAQITYPGCEAHLRNRRLVSAWPWKHVADLGDFTFRLLVPGVEFHAKRLAGGVL